MKTLRLVVDLGTVETPFRFDFIIRVGLILEYEDFRRSIVIGRGLLKFTCVKQKVCTICIKISISRKVDIFIKECLGSVPCLSLV